jgi:hypothetical protein
MATLLEVRTTEEKHSVVHFLLAEGLNAKDIHKGMFPAYVGKCLSRKAVHNWVEKFSHGRLKVADDETEARKCLRQVYQCWWRICQEINVFSSFEYHVFHILYPFVTYLLTPSYYCL